MTGVAVVGRRFGARVQVPALRAAGFDVVAQCTTADELLLKANSYPLDVAVVDIRLPPTHRDEGLRAALQIRADHPDVGVLVLSQYVELGLAMTLLADSAEGVGYLLKDRIGDVDAFIDGLRAQDTCGPNFVGDFSSLIENEGKYVLVV